MLIVQSDQCAPRFVRYRRIDRICTAQPMLGCQSESVERTTLAQHSDRHMRQPTQRDGKRLGLCGRLACPADRPGDFGQH